MSRDQLKRLKELEVWNTRLRRMVSDLTLEKMIPTEAARGTEGPRSETSRFCRKVCAVGQTGSRVVGVRFCF